MVCKRGAGVVAGPFVCPDGGDTLLMTTLAPRSARAATAPRRTRTASTAPILLLFAERTNGQARRVEGFVAHVLQRRHNHESVRFRIVHREDRPDLFERFAVTEVPTLVVIEGSCVRRRLAGYTRPGEVERLLAPWLH